MYLIKNDNNVTWYNIIVTHLYFRICGIENLVNAFRKGKENLIKRNL